MLDPLWSSEHIHFAHVGCEMTRVEKITWLVEKHPEVLEHLRVCFANDGGPGNCGRCRKCIKTMVTLSLLGALKQARGFPDEFPREMVEKLPGRIFRKGRRESAIDSEVRIARENLDLAKRVENPDAVVMAFLEEMLRMGRRMERRVALKAAWNQLLGRKPNPRSP